MATKRNYYKELSKLKNAVCLEILSELKRIGKDFETSEEEEKGEIEFFSYPVIERQNIETIKSDGRIILDKMTITFQKALDDETIAIADAIGLLEDLRDFK